ACSTVKQKPAMPNSADDDLKALRQIPSVDESIRALPAQMREKYNPDYLTRVVREVQERLREAIAGGRHFNAQGRDDLLREVVRGAEHRLETGGVRWRPVINATGVVIHTNLGRAMLAEAAVEAIGLAARSPITLEYDLEKGMRGDRDRMVEDDLCALTGAQA